MTGGKYYNVRRTTDLEQALTDINEVERGVFYTLSPTRNEPAYFVFVALSLIACRCALPCTPFRSLSKSARTIRAFARVVLARIEVVLTRVGAFDRSFPGAYTRAARPRPFEFRLERGL
jgi:hypothetical protein